MAISSLKFGNSLIGLTNYWQVHFARRLHNPNFLTNLKSVNEEEKNRKNNGAVGAVVFATLLSPILVPAAILSSPILVYDYKSSENQKEKFHLRLSSNKGLENYLSNLSSA
ncbi:hypothetical protein HHO47_19100 [Pseudoalteromonas arctica]|uniref:Uncharacterized protein n=2 Tax=Pseudoalteromonas arctica TaxID=394751 RepID=A0A7Y0HED3_9GAMM|nr:hypothetical protein [Pseudoalteromonas arctica]